MHAFYHRRLNTGPRIIKKVKIFGRRFEKFIVMCIIICTFEKREVLASIQATMLTRIVTVDLHVLSLFPTYWTENWSFIAKCRLIHELPIKLKMFASRYDLLN